MAKIKAIIFDLNGIIIHSTPLSQRVEEKFGINRDLFYKEFEKVLKVARIVHNRDSSLWQPIADLLKISIDDFLKFWFSGENVDLEMLDFAKQLKENGYKIFILSNNLKERTEFYRQNFPELFKTFDGTYFSCETGFVKPDSKAFENILNKNDIQAGECLFFDDSSTNVQTAINLGIKAQIFDGLEATKKFIEQKNV